MGLLGSSSKVKSVSTLSPSQRKLLNQTAGVIGSGLATGATAYTGELTADTPDYLSQAFDLAKQLYSTESFADIQKALSGQASGIPAYVFDPAGITNEWRDSFANPAMEMYKQNVLPLVREQFNLPGMTYSTAAANGVSNQLNNFYGQNVLPTLFSSLQSGRERAFQSGENAASRQLGATTALANLPNLAVSGVAGAAGTQMSLQQNSLDAAYREFMRMAPESNPWLNNAMSLSTAGTVENIGQQGWSMLGDFMKSGAAMGSAAIMASDVRVKENIVPISDALSKVRRLAAYKYNYKGSAVECIGLMAQDVERQLPDAVVSVDGTKMVKLYAIQSLIVQAIKELAKRQEN